VLKRGITIVEPDLVLIEAILIEVIFLETRETRLASRRLVNHQPQLQPALMFIRSTDHSLNLSAIDDQSTAAIAATGKTRIFATSLDQELRPCPSSKWSVSGGWIAPMATPNPSHDLVAGQKWSWESTFSTTTLWPAV
jgi:hypothetical protein